MDEVILWQIPRRKGQVDVCYWLPFQGKQKRNPIIVNNDVVSGMDNYGSSFIINNKNTFYQ